MNYLFITDCFIGNPASAHSVNSYFFKNLNDALINSLGIFNNRHSGIEYIILYQRTSDNNHYNDQLLFEFNKNNLDAIKLYLTFS